MKSPVALSRSCLPASCLRAGRSLTFGLLIALGACQGNLDNGIKQMPEGSGGDSGSGGTSASGGSTGTGGTTSSGGATGSGGLVGSSGGTVGSGGAVGTGGTQATGSGGMVSGSGGKAGGSGTASGGKIGSGGTAAGGSKGGGGMMGGGSGGSTTVACDAPTKVFKDSVVGCIDSGCHAKGAGNEPPDLQTADPTTLKAYKTKILCMGGSLVVPSDPTSSVLWKVVDGQTCGELMPKGKMNLSQDQEDCLASWIGSLK